MVLPGFTNSESSSVPARTKIRCGRESAALNMGVPHSGQNRRRMSLPLSATLRYSVNRPSTLSASLAKHTFTVPLPAARYWQTRHQQTRVTIGAALIR